MSSANTDWSAILHWVTTPWFTIGSTPITFPRLLGLVLIVAFVWWFAYLVEHTLRRIAMRDHQGQAARSNVYAVTRIIRYLIWIVGTIVGLNYIGFDLASFALVGGAVGVGIGFGLQNIFSNFVSGVIILLEKTLKVGDFVDLQSGVMGTVAEIGVRYTRVTTNDAVDILVPNSEFINGRVTNWTFDNEFRRMRVGFGVAYGSDKHLVREAGIAAAMAVKGTITDAQRKPDVWLVNFGDSSLDFELMVWVGQELLMRPGRTKAELLWALEDELRKRNIEIPFPQRDLHLRSTAVALSPSGDASLATGRQAPPSAAT